MYHHAIVDGVETPAFSVSSSRRDVVRGVPLLTIRRSIARSGGAGLSW